MKLIINGRDAYLFQVCLGLGKRDIQELNMKDMIWKGNLIKREVEGLHARVVQHEFDHLMGIMYISRLAHKMHLVMSDEIEEYWKNNREDKLDEFRKD